MSPVRPAHVRALVMVVFLVVCVAASSPVGRAQQASPALASPSAFSTPEEIRPQHPFSIAITAIPSNRQQLALAGDWDGREDLVADRSARVPGVPQIPGVSYTRAAVSAHTMANGFAENVFYIADSRGNVHVIASSQLVNTSTLNPVALGVTTLNIPGLISTTLVPNADPQLVITGLCVSPVVDLTTFSNIDVAFNEFTGKTGEVLYISYWDSNGTSTVSATTIRSGLLAVPIADTVSAAMAPPSPLSSAGFPVTVGGIQPVLLSTWDNVGGCAVDDDGSVYWHQADLRNLTGAAIVKFQEISDPQYRSVANPGTFALTGSVFNITATSNIGNVRMSNFSGTSTLFGNVQSMAVGPDNALYLAVASTDPSDPAHGPFSAPAALGPTPSMIISMTDTAPKTTVAAGKVVITDGIADTVGSTLVAGVNNFRVFAMGRGPDRRAAGVATSPVFGSVLDTLKLDFQIDASLYSGLVVDEAHNVYVVSGGTPAGVGTNPSPDFSDVLIFPDRKPFDRRADYVDLRANAVPLFSTTSNNGDGDSDRFDHLFLSAAIDEVTLKPAGVSGLSRGFLRYTNRLAPGALSPAVTLGQVTQTQGDDSFDGPIVFGRLAGSLTVTPAGGDDSVSPNRGDDAGTTGFPALPAGTDGGFEFNFGGSIAGVCTAPWNAFYLNSNGSISFDAGDFDNTPTAQELLTGPPRISADWTDLLPSARSSATNTFPVQALGFAGINEFKVRWINVPSFTSFLSGSRNTFSLSLFDDGTGADENSAAQEGPTDQHWLAGLVPLRDRPDSVAPFRFEYGLMDTSTDASLANNNILVGYSVGGLAAGSVAASNLSESGRTELGTGVQNAIFEFFASGQTLDLGSEGNNTAVASASLAPADVNREALDFFGKTCAAPPGVPLPTVDLVLNHSNLSTGEVLAISAIVTPANTGPVVGVPMDLYITLTLPTGQLLSLTTGGLVVGTVPIATNFVPAPFATTLFSAAIPGGAPAGGYELQTTLVASGTTVNVNPQDRYPFRVTP